MINGFCQQPMAVEGGVIESSSIGQVSLFHFTYSYFCFIIRRHSALQYTRLCDIVRSYAVSPLNEKRGLEALLRTRPTLIGRR